MHICISTFIDTQMWHHRSWNDDDDNNWNISLHIMSNNSFSYISVVENTSCVKLTDFGLAKLLEYNTDVFYQASGKVSATS